MQTEHIFELASKIMGDLGAGYSESIYQNALHRKLARIDDSCVMEKIIPVVYEGNTLGVCRADIVLSSHVIEIKAVRRMPPGAEKQVGKYVRHLMELDGKIRQGLVINFNQETETIETLQPQPLQNTDSSNAPNDSIRLDESCNDQAAFKRRKITPMQGDE